MILLSYFHEFTLGDVITTGAGLAIGLPIAAMGLVIGALGLGVGLIATAGAGVLVASVEITKMLTNGFPEIVDAIEKIPGFNKNLFQDPNVFRRKFNIENPKFITILRKELDDQVGITWQKIPTRKIRQDASYQASFYPMKYRFALKWNDEIGFSSAIVLDPDSYVSETVKLRSKNERFFKRKNTSKKYRDYGVIFKYKKNIITDIWCIKYKKENGKYVYYPYRLKCSDEIPASLYKRKKK